jgi:hypothetical protein
MNWHLLLFQVILLDTQVHLEQTNVNKRLSEYKNQIDDAKEVCRK